MRSCTPERSIIASTCGAEELGDSTLDVHVVHNFPKSIDFMKAVFRQGEMEQNTEVHNGTVGGACDYAAPKAANGTTKRARNIHARKGTEWWEPLL